LFYFFKLATIISIIRFGKPQSGYLPYSSNGDQRQKIGMLQVKRKASKICYALGLYNSFENLIVKKSRLLLSQKIIEKAIKGILLRGPLGRTIFKNFKVYAGRVQSQKPQLLINR
jgi:ribosomal protein L13